MRKLIFFILFFSLSYAVELTVVAEGFRNAQGLARIAVFSSAQGFPDRPTNNRYSASVKIVDGMARVKFSDLSQGDYAVSVLHDEDLDENIQLGFMGIPQEGYGISNGGKTIFGPPKFEESLVKLRKNKELVKIRVNY
jgi:uncharacterized protein (DUF2141 family)